MSDNPIDDAREFFSYSKMTDNIEEVLESAAPVKVGVDLENEEILLVVHDKMYTMDIKMTEAVIYAMWLSIRTLEAQRAVRNN